MAKRRADSSLNRAHSRRSFAMSDSADAMELTPEKDAAPGPQPVELSNAFLVGPQQEYYTKPYLRSAPLFLHDLQDHNLWEWSHFMTCSTHSTSGLFSAGFPPEYLDLFKSRTMPNVPATKHNLVLVPSQTSASDTAVEIVSTVCIRCLCHFVIRLDRSSQPASEGLCHLSAADMFHELEMDGFQSQSEVEKSGSRHYPLMAAATYRCRNDQCKFKVKVTVSRPRLPYRMIKLLLDEERITTRLTQAISEEPARYQNVDTSEWAVGAVNLLQRYLTDVATRNSQTGRGPISFSTRVKRFHIVFGPELYSLFPYLGFGEETVDGETHFVQMLPTPPPAPGTPSPVGSYQAFLEDCIHECKIHELRRHLVRRALSRDEAEKMAKSLGLVPAAPKLERALDCAGRPSHRTAGTVNYHVRFLGAMPDMSSGAVNACMNRRLRQLPDHEDALGDSLYTLARDRSGHLGQDSDFLREALRQVGEDLGDPWNEQWGLPPSGVRRTEDEIFAYFTKKLRSSDANKVESLLSCFSDYLDIRCGPRSRQPCGRLRFRVLGWGWQLLQTILNDEASHDKLDDFDSSHAAAIIHEAPMLLELAEALLDMDRAADAAEVGRKIERRGSQLRRLALFKAVEALHVHRPDLDLVSTVSKLEEDAKVEIMELREAKWGEALRRPLGLRNIGNTCYLNSILQYFYTINSVRELVKNYNQHRLSNDKRTERRIGATRDTVSELGLITGQYFTGEALPSLFELLRTKRQGPCSPSQGLANVVLLPHKDLMALTKSGAASNKKIKTDKQNGAKSPQPPPTAPPLPPRPEDSADSGSKTAAESSLPSPMSSSATLICDAISEMSYKMNGDQEAPGGDVQMTQPSQPAPPATPVEQDGDGDVQMDGTEGAHVKPKEAAGQVDAEAIRDALAQKHEFPMNQQDVEEMMGRIFDLMQAAILPDNVELGAKDGAKDDIVQMDVIMRTFFFDVMRTQIKCREDGTEIERKESLESVKSLIAYPGETGAGTLYDALEVYFGRETLKEQQEGDSTRVVGYSSIKTTPPILHVLIQRTMRDSRKNTNVVELTEYLDLDRFMESPDDSPLMRTRREMWDAKRSEEKLASLLPDLVNDQLEAEISPLERIAGITEPLADFDSDAKFHDMALDALSAARSLGSKEKVADLLERTFGAGAVREDDSSIPLEPAAQEDAVMTEGDTTEGDSVLSGQDAGQLFKSVADKVKAAIDASKAKRSVLFDDMHEHRYALHAVICHSGSGKGGHYWVWIRDFTTNQWRKYNDESTKETHTTTESLLKELNSAGHPFFVGYVRDAEREKSVSIPKRTPLPETSQSAPENSRVASQAAPEDDHQTAKNVDSNGLHGAKGGP